MTYTEIQADIAQWMHRSDLAGVIPRFIELAEEKINRLLRVRAMEIALAETPIVANRITLAADVLDVKTLFIPGNERTPLTAQSFESVIANGPQGIPTIYAHQGAELVFDGGGSVQGVLYQRIPALASASSNWLSVTAPSAYLFGALEQAALYTRDDPSVWRATFESTLSDLAANDNRRSGPLVARAR